MRLLALLASLLGCIAAICTQEPCNEGQDMALLTPAGEDQLYEKRFSPDALRRASIRWGKRFSPTKPMSSQTLRESSRFWGKRNVAESIRRASIRWGKRSSRGFSDLLPMGDLIYPSHLFQPKMNVGWANEDESLETPVEVPEVPMERVAKADALRPKLALSSRLWGR